MKNSLEQKRRKLKKTGRQACAFALSLAVMVPSMGLPSYAAVPYRSNGVSIGDKGMDTTSHFTANGIEESNLRYATTAFDKVDADGTIRLVHNKWIVTNGASEFATDASNQFAGKYILSFSNDMFYKQIDRVTVDDTSMEKVDDGALWMIPAVGNLKTGLIGVNTNHDIKIMLKNGQTLEKLGLADKEISFNSLWIKSNGAIAEESVSNGFILQNNPNVKNEKQTDFTNGRVNQRVVFDAKTMSLKSIHTFKPIENYLQTDYNWVVYVKERIPVELLQYIDRDEVYIYCSDYQGEAQKNRKIFRVTIDDAGNIDTSEVPELSIVGNDTSTQLSAARSNTNEIFWGTLGQSRNYTISYKLRDDVTLDQFAREMNDYVTAKNARVLFEHWMEADYLNARDGGATPQQLQDSYTNAYLDTNDTDKDGLFDFVEWQIGTDTRKVDTDGDGVPDGKEFMEDKTNPSDAKDYLVSIPTTNITSFDPTKAVTITGTVPKPLQKDPADETKLINITSQDAGDAIVKLQGYDDASKSYTQDEYGTAKIPFDNLVNGEFTMSVPANTVPEGTKVVLVAYSPNGMNPAMGTPFEFKQGDAEKYEATGGVLDKEYGETATASEIIGKVTTTAPDDKVKSKEVVGDIPTEGKGQKVKVKVTYADDSFDEVDVTVNYGTATEKYTAVGQDVSVGKGETPEASEGIKNKNDLPTGTTYEWKQPVDTTNPGTQPGTIIVTYPDQTKDEVEVNVQIKDTKTDAQTYDATGDVLNKKYGETATAAEIIGKVTTTAPDDKVKSKEVVGDIPTEGKGQKVKVKVTYADDSFDEVDVTVNYGTATEKYTAVGQDVSVGKGETPEASEGIKNKNDLPTGTTYEWKQPVDTSNPGTQTGRIIVTYPDQTKDEVEVTVQIKDSKNDAETYDVSGGVLNKEYGDKATKDEIIEKVTTTAPDNKVRSKEVVGTIPETGKGQKVKVKVTYVDGSVDEAEVTVNYGSASDKYEPEVEDETVKTGSDIDLTDNVTNLDELPTGTTVKDVTDTPIDTSVPGDYTGKVEITYPDGSKDIVEVPVKVVDKTDAERYRPVTERELIEEGQTYDLTDNVKNMGSLPTGTTVEDVTPEGEIDPDTPGNYTGTIKVIYPDGSSETVKVKVKVKKRTPDAKKYDPEVVPEIIYAGELADLTDNVVNLEDELPEGTIVTDITEYGEDGVNLDRPGKYKGRIEIEYPDGSTKELTVPIRVLKDADTDTATPSEPGKATPSEPDKATDSEAEKTDASKYKPKPNPIVIDQGETFEPEEGIKNKDELPEGTEYSDETPDKVDTSKDYTAIIVVTYPDGSKDKVKVPVTVRPGGSEKTDADKYDPKPNPIVIDKGGTFEPEDAIKNKDELPNGTEYRDETPDNVDKTKDYTAIIVVKYPDGSEDKVKVPVTVKPVTSGSGGSGSSGSSGGSSGGHSSGGSGGGSGSRGSNVSNDRIYANPDMSVTTGSLRGTWTLVDAENHKWTYTTSSGVMAKDGWMFIGNPYAKDEEGRFSWFKFDANGIMEFGWIKSQNGKWYHTHAVSDGNLGILHKGWYHEPMDGKWYYLDEKTGAMLDGWVSLSGKYYYFTEAPLVPEQTYFQRENGYWYYDNHNRRPYGSMYQNEMTPDNYFVDQNGVWDGKNH
ncbi:Rib/alpha-like domain-containing protein [Enterocloster bolteae]|uniref:Rib/alpha-like domain-containing protein n=2 Tax=Enterocloster bolteae TaxID=208479 RepID=UPI002A7EE9A4|nr:Rib/alpha-like domain-containing protein [Enterocloster bolteae]